MKIKNLRSILVSALFVFVFASVVSNAAVVQTLQGRSVVDGNVDNLLYFYNLSSTASPENLLSSYYFDIRNSLGQRPNQFLDNFFNNVYNSNKNDDADIVQTACISQPVLPEPATLCILAFGGVFFIRNRKSKTIV